MSSSDDEYEPSVEYSDISDSDDSEYESEVESDDNDPVMDDGWAMMPDPFSDTRSSPLPEYEGDSQASLKDGVNRFESENDAFYAFFDSEIVGELCIWMNERAEQFFRVRLEEDENDNQKVNGLVWKPISSDEMYIFLGLLMVMGINQLPRIGMYWSTHPMVGGPKIFCSKVMSRGRFLCILKFLRFGPPHLVEKGKPKTRIEPFLDLLRRKCKDILEPGMHIAIDEALKLWKGRLLFKQYIKTKRSRFGIKIFFLCPSDPNFSGYSWTFAIYYGKDSDFDSDDPQASHLSKSEQVVVYLMRDLLCVRRHVITDNWYTSLRLAEYLLTKDTLLTGTIRADRGPPEMLRREKLQKGQAAFARKGDVLVLKYQDKKDLHLLTTKYTAGYKEYTRCYSEGHVSFKKKPSTVTEYNELMGSVDKADQLLQPYSPERKSLAWLKKLGIHIMHRALLNSHLVYKKQQGPDYKVDFLNFTIKVAEQMVSQHSEGAKDILQTALDENNNRQSKVCKPKISPHHLIPSKKERGKKRAPQKRCLVCFAIKKSQGASTKEARKDTHLYCSGCRGLPGLCSKECHQKWHDNKWQRKYRQKPYSNNVG